ncbi:C69 peptidase-like protein [Aureococcus anophagefferens]|nr:C69 peptidase-like protein [Aureococcus anophagefferens]
MARLLSFALGLVAGARACSNILVTKGASADGRAHVSYNADDAALIGAVSHWPGRRHPPGATRDVYSWDSGKFLGVIPEPEATLNVVGNANEAGVVIGETTHGGLALLSNVGKTGANGTLLDYGDLEGFSITDGDEVWYMELTGRGDFDPHGVLYVALRVPDGMVLAHANQARIQRWLPCDNASACRASPDLVDFLVARGLYPADADPALASFSDAVDPVTFAGARFCEARVWDVFRRVPSRKLGRGDVHALMSSHFEDTWFDPAVDVGAAAEHAPYRWNGLEWALGNASYVNERVVGTQYTAWHFVASVAPSDAGVPAPMRAVLWFGADDHSWSPKIPIHGGARDVHRSYDDGDCAGRSACRRALGLPGTTTEFSLDNAWWLSTIVADQVYTRYDRAAPTVLAAKEALDARLAARLADAEAAATALFAAGDAGAALAVLDAHAVAAGALASETWLGLWQTLLVAYVDGRVTTVDEDDEVCGCAKESAAFTDAWKTKVVADTGDKYLARSDAKTDDDGRPKTMLRSARAELPRRHRGSAPDSMRSPTQPRASQKASASATAPSNVSPSSLAQP